MTDYDPNILADHLDVVFCGLNPGATALRSGHSFSSASNRFWPVLHQAGFTPTLLRPENERRLLDFGCGITAVVGRATTRAEEISATEFRCARPDLERRVARYRPRCLAFLGKRALAVMTGATVDWGRQPSDFAGAIAWVLPNPSGLNRGFTTSMLIDAYARLRRELGPPSWSVGQDVSALRSGEFDTKDRA